MLSKCYMLRYEQFKGSSKEDVIQIIIVLYRIIKNMYLL